MTNLEVVEKRKERVLKWVKDPYNLAIVGILALALIIRIYYLKDASYQALWWDEAEYMSTAKHWAFGVPYNLNEQRPPLFQLLGAGLLALGASENALKFCIHYCNIINN